MIVEILKLILAILAIVGYLIESFKFTKTRDAYHGINSIIWLLLVIWMTI